MRFDAAKNSFGCSRLQRLLDNTAVYNKRTGRSSYQRDDYIWVTFLFISGSKKNMPEVQYAAPDNAIDANGKKEEMNRFMVQI